MQEAANGVRQEALDGRLAIAALAELRRFLAAGDGDAAEQILTTVFVPRPDYRDEYGHPVLLKESLRLALVRGDQGRAADLADQLSRVIPSDDPTVHALLARDHARRGHLLQAEAEWKAALTRRADLEEARVWLSTYGTARVSYVSDLASIAHPTTERGFWPGCCLRQVFAPTAAACSPLPLKQGTEAFASASAVAWHQTKGAMPSWDVASSYAADAIVSGSGQVWLDDKLVVSPELMPRYAFDFHGLARGGRREFLATQNLPVRVIERPCAVLSCHGIAVYGHFLIEVLMRVLLLRRAMRGTSLPWAVLLDEAAPSWLVRILVEDLGIAESDIERFQPRAERVQLRHAILPGLVHRDSGFHPFANELIEDLKELLAPLPQVDPIPRAFLVRRGISNRHSLMRAWKNESDIVELALRRHGFMPVQIETLPWKQQIALLSQVEIALGEFGSGLHGTLFADPGTRVAAIGKLNPVQSEIGALRGHLNAYLDRDVQLSGEFSVDEAVFTRFIDAVCDEE